MLLDSVTAFMFYLPQRGLSRMVVKQLRAPVPAGARAQQASRNIYIYIYIYIYIHIDINIHIYIAWTTLTLLLYVTYHPNVFVSRRVS